MLIWYIGNNGIGVEPRRRNIFYDEIEGFTTIDVATLNSTEDSDSLENVSSFFNTYSRVIPRPFSEDEKDENGKN